MWAPPRASSILVHVGAEALTEADCELEVDNNFALTHSHRSETDVPNYCDAWKLIQ